MSACAHRDDAGSYVLRAMPDDEHERFEAHLATCEECRREVADLQVAADTLPLAAVQVGPPPELRDRIMTIVRSEAELLGAAGARADEPAAAPAATAPRRRRRWSLSLRPLPAAMAASVLVAAGVIGGIVLTGGSDTQDRDRDGADRLGPERPARRCSSPTTRPSSRCAACPRRRAARSTRCGSSARTRNPAPTTALFRTDPSGSADVEIQRGRLKGVEQVLVTAEPDGGSMKPTSAPVIVASTA